MIMKVKAFNELQSNLSYTSSQEIIQNCLLKTGGCLIEVHLSRPYDRGNPYNNEFKIMKNKVYTGAVIAFFFIQYINEKKKYITKYEIKQNHVQLV